MKRVLLIHPGYGKTATTWLQRKVLPNVSSSLYLGKDPFFSNIFERSHNNLFEPLYGIDTYRARNSATLIDKYANLIRLRLNSSGTPIKRVILSDECILDYANYNAELNIYILSQLVRKLENDFDEIKILVTIRNQETYLTSYFAYDYQNLKGRFRSFDKFIQYGYDNPTYSVFGGIHYHLVLAEMNRLFGKEKVKFLPYEYLVENPENFIRQIAIFFEVEPAELVKYASAPSENVNITKEGKHAVRDMNLLGGAILNLSVLYKKSGIFNAMPNALNDKIKFFRNIVFKRLSGINYVGNVAMDERTIKMVRSMYVRSNQELAKLADIDLEKLGWPV